MALTDAWLKANNKKKRDKVVERADRDGMSARVSAGGKITFQIRYRYAGKASRVDIGTYPMMTLKEARDESARLKGELEKGRDPKVVKRMEMQERLGADTLGDVFDQWYRIYCSKNKAHHADVKRSFEIHVLPKLGKIPAAEVGLDPWMALLDKLADTKPGIADRVLTNAKQMLNWAARRQLVPFNVLSAISAKNDLSIASMPVKRALSDAEIRHLFDALENSRMTRKNAIFVHLCLLFGCRTGELRTAEKSHFDLEAGVWTIPPELHKTGASTDRPIIRPIVPGARVLLEQAFDLSHGSRYAFTNAGSSQILGRGAPLSWPRNVILWLKRHRKYDMELWTIHDLRRTARTNWATLTQPHVAEIMLGHALPGEWRTYDQHEYLKEQGEAYQAWWDRLEDIRTWNESGEKPS